jgi:regulator of cell morphogenesis and NO signaling
MKYHPSDKMCDLMRGGRVAEHGQSLTEEQVLQLMNRFGISMGVGEKSIEEVCAEHQVDCPTVMAIINYALCKELPLQLEELIHIPTLHRYLENAHTYFLKFQLPRIRQELLEAINLAHSTSQVPLMIIQFFDEYAREIKSHIDHEMEHSYEQHARDDEHIANKAHELKTLIIKYYPTNTNEDNTEQMRLLYAVLHDLRHFENELALHCAIEDDIMLPALRKEQRKQSQHTTNEEDISSPKVDEVLSAREIEVIRYVAQGLSNKEIADVMCLSTHTVMSHRKNIARKLDIHSTAGLTIYAVVNGIVEI